MRKSLLVGSAMLAAGLVAWLCWPRSDSPSDAGVAPLDLPPLSYSGHLFDARRHLAAGDLVRAEADVKAALAEEALTAGRRGELLLVRAAAGRAAGDDGVARAALEEVAALCPAADWRGREARARLADLAALSGARRRQWAEADGHARAAAHAHERADYREAIRRGREALAACVALWGEGHAETARARLSLGLSCREHDSAYREAAVHLEKARVELEWIDADHPDVGDCLLGLATLADGRGAFEEADRLYEAALASCRQARGEASIEFARALNRQGRMHVAWSKNYAQGKCDRALMIRGQILSKDHVECAESLENLGVAAYNGALDTARAEALLKQAIAIREKAQGPDHPALAEALGTLGATRTFVGDLSEGYAHVRRALRLLERAHGPNHPAVTPHLRHMGYLQDSLMDQSAGERYLRRALAIRERLGLHLHPEQLRARALLVNILQYECGLRYGAADVPIEAIEKDAMASIRAFEAVPGGTDLPAYAEAVCNLAKAYYWNDYAFRGRAIADRYLKRAKECIDDGGKEEHPFCFQYYYARGRWHMSAGEHVEAERIFRRARDLVKAKFARNHPYQNVEALNVLAGLYMHKGGAALEVTKPLLQESLTYSEEMFVKNAASLSDQARLASLYRWHLTLSGYLSVGADTRTIEGIYRDILALRGVAAACQVADRTSHDYPELRPLLARVREARRGLAALMFNPPAGTERAEWVARVEAASDAKEDLEFDLALAVKPFAKAIEPLEPAALQKRLPAGTALIDFFQYDHFSAPPSGKGRLVRQRRLVAFVVTPTGRPACVPLGPSDEIGAAIHQWRGQLGDLGRAEAVAARVWAPLRKHLGDASTVLIAPDGPVCYLPFAALPGRDRDPLPGRKEKEKTFLLEDHAIGFVPSGRAAFDLLGPAPDVKNAGMLAVGGVTYERGGGTRRPGLAGLLGDGQLADLPATRPEAEQAVKLFPASEGKAELLAGEVGPRAFLDALKSKRGVIHFAGHGFFAAPEASSCLTVRPFGATAGQYVMTDAEKQVFGRNQLMLSGLALSRDDRAGTFLEDGIVTAEELGGVDMRGTGLVVLSACQTGLGNTAGGEGVVGLHRALLAAGARSVVSSLWKVEDAATSLLMEEFYKALWGGKKVSKLDALRQAQLSLLRYPERITDRAKDLRSRGIKTGVTRELPATPSSRLDPSLWAAFVLYGDGR